MKILLVDDDATFRNRLGQSLERHNHTVKTVGTAQEALVAVSEFAPEAILLDLKLRDESGLILLRRLKDIMPELRIVVLTGYGSVATAVEAVRLGAADYLAKPADVRQVEAALQGSHPLTTDVPVPSLERVEWEHLQRVLEQCDHNVSQTARVLGIDRRTLQRKLNRLPPRQ